MNLFVIYDRLNTFGWISIIQLSEHLAPLPNGKTAQTLYSDSWIHVIIRHKENFILELLFKTAKDEIFSSAEIWFSLDGERYQSAGVRAIIPADRMRESARNVTIKLRGRPARFIRIRLSFADKWMLISEIAFDSLALTNNLTEDDLQRYYLIPDTAATTTAPGVPSGETTHARKEVTPATSPTSSTQAYIGLITGALAMVILLLACTVFLMIRRGRKKVNVKCILRAMYDRRISTLI
ncbi:unnamed protein product [Psylliodes chrysocephalus]|uniref:Discoidin domain-containing protein n=1 Tax=Psylliodes chrysocephalus TaxID=3402493 RepID=A0A9P0CJS4_9CUCU|nr:unnamed protein product [Psylliodes chrysocephala]